MRSFWAAHQRFFRAFCTAAKVPVTIALAKKAGKIWDDAEEIGRKAAIERGNKITYFDTKTVKKMKKITKIISKKWIKNLNKKNKNGDQIYKDASELIRKYSELN